MSPNEPLRQETVRGRLHTTPAQTANGGAIISTRDTVTFGFGLEQVERADAQRARQAHHGLPAAGHGRHDGPDGRAAGSTRSQNWQATPADPVDAELTAFDERGDMKEVRLYANGTYYATTSVYPFQFRYTPPASAVGTTVVADG